MSRAIRRPGSPRSFLAAALVAAALAGACGPDGKPREEKPPPSPQATGEPIVIALLPERNVFEQKKRYQPLADYLSAEIGRPVEFKLLDNYQLIFSEILESRVDGGFFGSMNGTIAQLKGGVEILARPVELSGVSTYWGYVYTRVGSGITDNPDTWRGKRAAFVNKATTAGYLFPLALMRRAGYQGPAEEYFSQVTYTGSHDASILAVFNNEADLGASKNTVFDEYLRLHPDIAQAITVLAQSAEVPSNGLGVRPHLDPDLKSRLKKALLGMHESADGQRTLRQFRAQRFIDTSFEDYRSVADMAKRAGIDLEAWPLREVH